MYTDVIMMRFCVNHMLMVEEAVMVVVMIKHLLMVVGVVDIGDGGGEYTIGVGGVVIIGGGELKKKLGNFSPNEKKILMTIDIGGGLTMQEQM